MTDIARDDLALDAIAAGAPPVGDDEVLDLLFAFRTDLEPEPDVVVPFRRARRRGALIVLSAAAGLILGGLTTGAVVTADEPGQLFYAAHKAMLGDPRGADRVTKLLDDAAEEIAEGDLRAARDRLDKAAERLGDVEDPAERNALRARLDRLSALAVAPAAAPSARPSASPSDDDDSGPRETETPEPAETESPDDGSSGKGGGGSDDSSGDSSGKGSSNSGSGSDD